MPKHPSRLLAALEVVLVTMIWATSYVFGKLTLAELGPLTMAGLRFFGGFLILLPWLLRRNGRKAFTLPKTQWIHLALLGLCCYLIGNGAMYWSLRLLPATTVSFLMGWITLLVLVGGVIWLKERPTGRQLAGIFVALAGLMLFFSGGFQRGEPQGLAVITIALLGFAAYGLLGRRAARDRMTDTLTLTAVPLAVGGGALLLIALPLEGWPQASPLTWGLVIWMAIVNTALGYVLYNHALQTLSAFEMNVLLNLSPVWTALFGWLLLGEVLTPWKWAGMLIVFAGIALVQSSAPRLTIPPPD